MTIVVKLFGPQARMCGRTEVSLEVSGEGATYDALTKQLAEAEPSLRESLATSRLAVNHEYALPEQISREGDDVALIGMVSGG